MSARRIAVLLALLALAIGAVSIPLACGGDDDSEPAAETDESTSPITPDASQETDEEEPVTDGDEGTGGVEPDDQGSADGGGTGGTSPGGGGGGSKGYRGDDTAKNDIPPPPGSPAEEFERYCEQNPGAC